MIKNVSYNNPEIKKEINDLVGRPFSLTLRLKLKGIGSPKYLIKESSKAIQEKLDLDNNLNYCSIELRPNGIIVAFRSILETFAWIITYDQFRLIVKNEGYRLTAGDEYMEFTNQLNFRSADSFIKKVIKHQNSNLLMPEE